MAQLTKQALIVENNQSFPNNNAGAITPTVLRQFNTDIIDSTVNQSVYTADSGSWNEKIDGLSTGSALITASVDFATITFTKGDGSQFDLTVTASVASVDWDNVLDKPAGLVSGSSQVVDILTSVNSFTASQEEKDSTLASYTGSVNQKFSTIGTQSGSWDNTSLNQFSASQESKDITLAAYTGSINTKFSTLGSQSGSWITNSQTSSMSVNFANTATSASHAVIADSALTSITSQDIIVYAKNTSGAIIPKGAVVRITGASGDNPEIGLADWTNDSVSANTLGITAESVAINGFTNVITQGRIVGLSTQAFTAGQVIFLGPSGTIVASVPTPYHEVRLGQVLRSQANNGSIYVSIDNGYELTELHDVNIVTSSLANNDLLAYDSASLQWTNKSINNLGIPQLNANNTFTGTLNQFQNISAVSASFQYVQTVTGSAVIIGNSFVVVNNDTPVQPYGGLSVYDSGSVTPTTSSLVWDGNTNDWKYSYDVGAGHDASVMLFGPAGTGLANTPYPTNNKLQKGTGGHHLASSTIDDDGTNVSIGANVAVTGSIKSNGVNVVIATDLNGLNAFTQSQEGINTALNTSTASQQISIDALNSFTASYTPTNLGPLNSFTQSQELLNTQLLNASTSFEEKFIYIGTQSGSWSGGGTDLTSLNAFTSSQQILNAQFATTGSNTFEGNQTINGNLNLIPASVSTNASYVIPFISGSTISKDSVDTVFYNPLQNSLFVSASTGRSSLSTIGVGVSSGSGVTTNSSNVGITSISTTAGSGRTIILAGNPSLLGAPSLTSNTNPGILATSGSGVSYVAIELQASQSFTDGRVTIKRPLIAEEGSEITGSLTVSTDITADRLVLTGGTGVDLIVTGSGRISSTFNVGPATGDQSYMSQYGFSATNSTTGDETGITNNGLDYGVSGWNGPSIYGNDPDDLYPALIGFQNKADWTDGTITVLKPLDIIGSLTVSGSINNSVHTLSITSNTASIDASVGTTFVLSLVDATNTRLEVSNTTYGQTLNLLVSQSAAGTGTLTFGENFYEPSGSFYSASAVASAKDIVTLATFVEPNVVYVASIKNLIV